MRLGKRTGIGLLTAGLALGGWSTTTTFAQDKPAEPAGERERAERRGRPDGPPGERRGGPGDRERGRGEPRQMFDRLEESLKDLNLSEEQKTKTKAILDKARADLDAAMKDGQDPAARREKVREINRTTREEVLNALDETQRERMRQQMRGRAGGPPDGARPDGPPGERPGPGGPRGPGGPGFGPGGPDRPRPMARVREQIEQLKLTDEQRPKVRELLAETEKKIDELAAEMRKTMETNREKLDALLTEEQRTQLRELMRPPGGPDGPRGEGDRPDRPGRRDRRGPGGEGGQRRGEGRGAGEGGAPPPPPKPQE